MIDLQILSFNFSDKFGDILESSYAVIAIVCAFILGHLFTMLIHSIRYEKKQKKKKSEKEYPPKIVQPTYKKNTPKNFSFQLDSLNNIYDKNTPKGKTESKNIEIGVSSVIGARKYQQDSVIAMDENLLKKINYKKCFAVLCDGMGGMENGDLASKLSSKTLYDDYIKSSPQNIPQFFRKEVKKIDKMVSNLTADNKAIKSGSTLVSVIIDNKKLYWVSVGDSRIYVIRNNAIVQITTDHNYFYLLKKQADSGMISYEEAASNPKGEALISYIGIGKDSEIGYNDKAIELLNNDFVLLCSDGLYKTVSDIEIVDILSRNKDDVNKAANALTTAALDKKRKGQDNTSVVLIKIL